MVCVEDDVDPCAVDTRKDPAARAAAARVEGIQFDTDAAYRAVEFGHQICPELCAADPACLYFQVETTFRPAREQTLYPRCYLFDALRAEDVLPASSAEASALASWSTDAASPA
mgnify:CR=1 FL=1